MSKFINIATNTTTTVKSGLGILDGIIINTKGGSANTIKLYDNTAASGTVIGTIDSTQAQVRLQYGLNFATGLTVVTATGTAADITIVYR